MAILLWACGIVILQTRLRPRETTREIASSLFNTGAAVLLVLVLGGWAWVVLVPRERRPRSILILFWALLVILVVAGIMTPAIGR